MHIQKSNAKGKNRLVMWHVAQTSVDDKSQVTRQQINDGDTPFVCGLKKLSHSKITMIHYKALNALFRGIFVLDKNADK